jgi:hypothetical protein
MRRRGGREINIFNIAFLDVITGALGAFVLLVVMLSASVRQGGGSRSSDDAQLRATISRLNSDLAQLRAINQSLSQANTALQNDDQAERAERNRLDKIRPIIVITEWDCSDSGIAVYTETVGKNSSGDEMPPFDPGMGDQLKFWDTSAHFLQPTAEKAGFPEFAKTDVWFYRISNVFPKMKVFYALSPPFHKSVCRVQSMVINEKGGFYAHAIELSPAKPWAIAFLTAVDGDGTVSIAPGDENALTPTERANINRWLAKTASERLQTKD